MFTNPLQPGNQIQNSIDSLMTQVDANKDGVVSTDEFAEFLTTLLKMTEESTGEPGLPEPTVPQPTQPIAPPIGSPHMSFEGFDLARAQDPEKSAKDAFAQLTSATGTMPLTKVEAEQWFEQNIRAGMEELGHQIDWVKGDKFQFTNWQGTYVVDFVRGADGPNPSLTWMADAASGVPTLSGGMPPTLDPGLTVQAAFEKLAAAAQSVPQTKQEAEDWFNSYIREGLESIGVNIDWVIGDKFEYQGASGPTVVDFIVGADGPNPELGWLVE